MATNDTGEHELMSLAEQKQRIIDVTFQGDAEQYSISATLIHFTFRSYLEKCLPPLTGEKKMSWLHYSIGTGSHARWSPNPEGPIRTISTYPSRWIVGALFTPTDVVATRIHLDREDPVNLLRLGAGDENNHPAIQEIHFRLLDPYAQSVVIPTPLQAEEISGVDFFESYAPAANATRPQ
jgi:hypothetical protein